MRKHTLLFFLLTLPLLSQAQTISFDLSFGIPKNDFKRNTDATGFGADLTFLMPLQKSFPLSFGLDFNYLVYGLNSRNETLRANLVTSGGAVLSTLEIPLRIVHTSSIFGTHAVMRAQAPLKNIQPYIEGLVGFRYISTNTKILDRTNDRRYSNEDSDVIVRKTILGDWVFSYGYGGGVMIQLSHNLFLDLRADFFRGRKAKYFDGEDTKSWKVEFIGSNSSFDPQNIKKDDLRFETKPRESTTDLLILKFGVAFKI